MHLLFFIFSIKKYEYAVYIVVKKKYIRSADNQAKAKSRNEIGGFKTTCVPDL